MLLSSHVYRLRLMDGGFALVIMGMGGVMLLDGLFLLKRFVLIVLWFRVRVSSAFVFQCMLGLGQRSWAIGTLDRIY